MNRPGGKSTPGDPRHAIVAACLELGRRGLSYGTSGNVSVRHGERQFYISPTGLAYETLEPEDVPLMTLEGQWFGRRRPSSEWRFHGDLYRHRGDVNAIVHTHSTNATALACTGRGIPAFHYMVARAGGPDIRCAPYFTFGTQALADAVVAALDGRQACLLANHGVIAVGTDWLAALSLAGEVEALAGQYCAARALGDVRILDDTEMARVLEKFRSYGRQDAADAGLFFGGPYPGDAVTGDDVTGDDVTGDDVTKGS